MFQYETIKKDSESGAAAAILGKEMYFNLAAKLFTEYYTMKLVIIHPSIPLKVYFTRRSYPVLGRMY